MLLLLACHSTEIRPQANLEKLREKYFFSFPVVPKKGIEVRNPYTATWKCTPPKAEDLEKFIPWLEEELSLYPSDFLRAIHAGRLKNIFICGDLWVGNSAQPAGTNAAGWMLLGMNQFLKTRYDFRSILHHELLHATEHALGRIFNSRTGLFTDPDWNTLNPKDFKYGNPLIGGNDPKFKDPWFIGVMCPKKETPMHFVNFYSQAAENEDRGEVFSFLIMEYKELNRVAAINPPLQKKIKYIKKLVSQLSSTMNEDFWQKISQREAWNSDDLSRGVHERMLCRDADALPWIQKAAAIGSLQAQDLLRYVYNR